MATRKPQLITVQQAAALRGVDGSTVSRWIKLGGLKCLAFSERVRLLDRADVLAYQPPPAIGEPGFYARRSAKLKAK